MDRRMRRNPFEIAELKDSGAQGDQDGLVQRVCPELVVHLNEVVQVRLIAENTKDYLPPLGGVSSRKSTGSFTQEIGGVPSFRNGCQYFESNLTGR